jgi:endonuclease/exonuclease/phosphatase (EEP) superfamily protein YafD
MFSKPVSTSDSQSDLSMTQKSVFWLARFAVKTIMDIGCLVLALSLLGFLNSASSLFDIFSHFRWQCCAAMLGFALFAGFQRKKLLCALFLGAALANGFLVAQLWTPPSALKVSSKSPRLSILDMNLFYRNPHYEQIRREIARADADVVVVEELTSALLNGIKPALTKYPYQLSVPREDCYGIAIFSKYPFTRQDADALKMGISFAIAADIKVGNEPVTICAIHTLPPLNEINQATNENMIKGLAQARNGFRQSTVLVGDLNATPFSHFFEKLLKTGNYIDSEQGFGLQCSWPVGGLCFVLPIDHVFVSPNIRVESRQLGQETGSDHFPLLVRLAIVK